MIAADAEELVVAYLAQSFANVGLDMPNTPPLPFYLVNRLPSPSDWITDHALISVHAFAATRTAAAEAARQLDAVMNPWVLTPKLSFNLSNGPASIDRMCVLERPAWHNYENPNLQRYCGRYRIELRMNQSS
ncbi:hypothetical protein [Mycobacterium colombiense]|uniref:hypothetical protein n=1 Tax=Mycobacterium colombiense TaxID=339268 RepID=UPI0010579187|nr:hypothetical protein [Mycobacterium colombiense]